MSLERAYNITLIMRKHRFTNSSIGKFYFRTVYFDDCKGNKRAITFVISHIELLAARDFELLIELKEQEILKVIKRFDTCRVWDDYGRRTRRCHDVLR